MKYTVKQGDTLSGITPNWQGVKTRSGNQNLIYAGEELDIPDMPAAPSISQPQNIATPSFTQQSVSSFGAPASPSASFSSPVSSTAAQPSPQLPEMKPFAAPQASLSGQSPAPKGAPKPSKFEITQKFGNRNDIEQFSGGINNGTDFATPEFTPVYLPKGKWEVLDAYNQAEGGYLGDATNQGWGNSVLVKNHDTGEQLRMSHLSRVGVDKGQIIDGGMVGLTGATGNNTGPHLDAEYYNPDGSLGDIEQTDYMNSLFDEGQPEAPKTLPSMDQKQDYGGFADKIMSVAPPEAQEAVKTNLPYLVDAFKKEGIDDPNVLAYAMATIQHETAGTFNPIEEYGGREQAQKLGYGGGENYYGRGFIQLTHDSNYRDMGQRIGMGDTLVQHPELALDPQVSAEIMAAFFKDRGVAEAAKKGDFYGARSGVNGTDQADNIANLATRYRQAFM